MNGYRFNSKYCGIKMDYKIESYTEKSIKPFFDIQRNNLKNDKLAASNFTEICLNVEYDRAFDMIDKCEYDILKQDLIDILSDKSRGKIESILDSYKKEYDIINTYEKDLDFYTDLLAWYKNISKKLPKFIGKILRNEEKINSFEINTDYIENHYNTDLIIDYSNNFNLYSEIDYDYSIFSEKNICNPKVKVDSISGNALAA